jgi:hypothetical protein
MSLSFETSTSIQDEVAHNRFQVHSRPLWGDPVVRPYCVQRHGVYMRVNPTRQDKFLYTETYKLYAGAAPPVTTSGYKITNGADLPKGNYIFIVTKEGDDFVLTLSRVYSNDVELGSRHSIMPDALNTRVYSAGELIKESDSLISYDFKSYTFGDPLLELAKEAQLKKLTTAFLERIFVKSQVSYNRFLEFRFTDAERAKGEDEFKKGCASMQRYDSMSACDASLTQRPPMFMASSQNACSAVLTPEQLAFAERLKTRHWKWKNALEPFYPSDPGDRRRLEAAWKLVRSGEDDVQSYIHLDDEEESRREFLRRYPDAPELFESLRQMYTWHKRKKVRR